MKQAGAGGLLVLLAVTAHTRIRSRSRRHIKGRSTRESARRIRYEVFLRLSSVLNEIACAQVHAYYNIMYAL